MACDASTQLQCLLVDCFDSFSFNLYQFLHEIAGLRPFVVHPNTPYAEIEALLPYTDAIILGPGPGRPECEADFGVCAKLLLQDEIPVLGVCLGHQGLAHVFGARIVHAREPMHGRASTIVPCADDALLFRGLPARFDAIRYNSLVVDRASLPATLRCTATSADGDEVMALEYIPACRSDGGAHIVHKHAVQFHPESILSQPHGAAILSNFLLLACRPRRAATIESPSQQFCVLPAAATAAASISGQVFHPAAHLRARHVTPTIAPLIGWIEPTVAFEALYAHSRTAFWLDSSRVETGISRFSFMGDGAGPLSHMIQFNCADRTLRTFCAGTADAGDDAWTPMSTDCVPPASDFFAALASLCARFALTTDADALSHVEFDFCGGYVGFLGYEMRNETDAVQRAQDSGGGGGDAHVHAAHTARIDSSPRCAAHYATQPDCMFVFADRFVVFDAHTRRAWTVALVDAHDDAASAAPSAAWAERVAHLLHALPAAADMQVAASVTTTTTTASLSIAPQSPAPVDEAAADDAIELDMHLDQRAYLGAIDACHSAIRDGESYELCLTNQFFTDRCVDPARLFARLRQTNPVPHAALLNFAWRPCESDIEAGDSRSGKAASECTSMSIVCSSPERFLRVDRRGGVSSKPIKGTLPRGRTAAEDEALRARLATSAKDRAENLMIVDLIRSDLGRVCVAGSVRVPRLMSVESYATVHQLVSTVTGALAHASADDSCGVLRATFPPGSMTGAPKLRSTHILNALERGRPRGVYSGALGYVSLNGACDLCVVIRTAVCTKFGTSLGAGGAIVAQSERDDEFDEVLLKTKAVAAAIAHVAGARGGVRVRGCTADYAPAASVV